MAVAAGIAIVPPMACLGTPQGVMESVATPWGAVGRPWCAMGGYHGHATNTSNCVEPGDNKTTLLDRPRSQRRICSKQQSEASRGSLGEEEHVEVVC